MSNEDPTDPRPEAAEDGTTTISAVGLHGRNFARASSWELAGDFVDFFTGRFGYADDVTRSAQWRRDYMETNAKENWAEFVAEYPQYAGMQMQINLPKLTPEQERGLRDAARFSEDGGERLWNALVELTDSMGGIWEYAEISFDDPSVEGDDRKWVPMTAAEKLEFGANAIFADPVNLALISVSGGSALAVKVGQGGRIIGNIGRTAMAANIADTAYMGSTGARGVINTLLEPERQMHFMRLLNGHGNGFEARQVPIMTPSNMNSLNPRMRTIPQERVLEDALNNVLYDTINQQFAENAVPNGDGTYDLELMGARTILPEMSAADREELTVLNLEAIAQHLVLYTESTENFSGDLITQNRQDLAQFQENFHELAREFLNNPSMELSYSDSIRLQLGLRIKLARDFSFDLDNPRRAIAQGLNQYVERYGPDIFEYNGPQGDNVFNMRISFDRGETWRDATAYETYEVDSIAMDNSGRLQNEAIEGQSFKFMLDRLEEGTISQIPESAVGSYLNVLSSDAFLRAEVGSAQYASQIELLQSIVGPAINLTSQSMTGIVDGNTDRAIDMMNQNVHGYFGPRIGTDGPEISSARVARAQFEIKATELLERAVTSDGGFDVFQAGYTPNEILMLQTFMATQTGQPPQTYRDRSAYEGSQGYNPALKDLNSALDRFSGQYIESNSTVSSASEVLSSMRANAQTAQSSTLQRLRTGDYASGLDESPTADNSWSLSSAFEVPATGIGVIDQMTRPVNEAIREAGLDELAR